MQFFSWTRSKVCYCLLGLNLSWLSCPIPTRAERYDVPHLVVAPTIGEITPFFQSDQYFADDQAFYFRAVSSNTIGTEPWVSDGTAAGTHLLRDLCPGACSSWISPYFELAGEIYTIGFDGGRNLLFKIVDRNVLALFALPGTSPPEKVFVFGGEAYFVLNDRIVRSNGSEDGTQVLQASCPSGSNCAPTLFATPEVLFVMDRAGLARVLPSGEIQRLAELSINTYGAATFGDQLAFFVYDARQRSHAFISDGTPEGTHTLEGSIDGEHSGTTRYFVSWRGNLYFRGYSGAWLTSDGTAAGTREIPFAGIGPRSELIAWNRDYLLYSTELESGHHDLHSVGPAGQDNLLLADRAYFQAWGALDESILIDDFSSSSPRIYFTDGTAAGTAAVEHFSVGARAFAWHGRLYMAGSTKDAPNSALWSSSGAAAGVELVYTSPPAAAGFQSSFYLLDRSLWLLRGYPGKFLRIDVDTLEVTEVDTGATNVLGAAAHAIIATDPENNRILAIRDEGVSVLLETPYLEFGSGRAESPDGYLFFSLSDRDGRNLWQSDGTPEGTRILVHGADRLSASNFSGRPPHPPILPSPVVISGRKILFGSLDPGQYPKFQIWSFDRDAATLELILNGVGTSPLIADSGHGWAVIYDLSQGISHLWVTDGTAARTRPVAQLENVELRLLGPVGHNFLLADARHGHWWTLDQAGSLFPLAPRATPGSTISIGDQAFSAALDGILGNQLLRLDGTWAGATWLTLSETPLGAGIASLYPIDHQRFVFGADDRRGAGLELWISDGTSTGTTRLSDIAPGPKPSNPGQFLRVGDRLFFLAEGNEGRALWVIDLPPRRPDCPSELLCLLEDRFEVQARAFAGGKVWPGQRVASNAAAGTFRFFSTENWELMVEVIDGCRYNSSFGIAAVAASDVEWELDILDRATGQQARFHHPAGSPPRIDEPFALPGCGALPSPARYPPSLPLTSAASRCPDDGASLCLGTGGRFRVRLEFGLAGTSGVATPWASGSQASGIFSLIGLGHADLLVKMLDACAIDGHHWFFAARNIAADLRLRVEDQETGQTVIYSFPAGEPRELITDTTTWLSCTSGS